MRTTLCYRVQTSGLSSRALSARPPTSTEHAHTAGPVATLDVTYKIGESVGDQTL